MSDIDFGAISEALNDKMDRDANNIESPRLPIFLVDVQYPTVANNYTWYRLYSDGWVEQGGSGSTMNMTITLPIKMADTNYFTNVGFVIANYGAQNINKYVDRVVTSSSAQNSCTYGGWYVCGMAA